MFTGVMIASIALVILVVALSLLTINKGYGYKHTIDPLPEEYDVENKAEKNR